MKISDYPDLISDDEFSFLIAADWLEEQGRDYEAECLRQGYMFNIWLYFLSIDLNYTLHYGSGYDGGVDYSDGNGYGDGVDYGHGYGHGYGTFYGNGAGIDYGDGIGYGTGDGTGHDFDELLLLFFASIFQRISNS
jgi:hypothetical protein